MADIGDGRPLRVCDLCGQVDDHPRHVIAGAMRDVFPRVADEVVEQVLANAPEHERGRLLRELLDTASSDRHLDCCREAGCPDGSCDIATLGAEGRRGAELLEHLVTQSGDIQARAEAERQRQLDVAIRTELLGEN